MIPRIVGLETEYALAFEPDPACRWAPPTRRELYAIVAASLGRNVAMIPGLLPKEEAFATENGSILHYEHQHLRDADGLFEWASPECASPVELAGYSQAQDQALLAAADAQRELLAERGFAGRILLLRNNADALGNSYGSHENYRVRDRAPAWMWLARVLVFLPLWLTFVALRLASLAVQLVILVAVYTFAAAYLAVTLTSRLPGVRVALRRLVARLDVAVARAAPRVDRALQRAIVGSTERAMAPILAAFGAFGRALVFADVRKGLVAHLATRTILCGAGRIRPANDGRIFDRSQRAAQTGREIGAIHNVFRSKPMIDIKALLLAPLELHARYKRLHVVCGDSNRAEPAELFKLASTALVLDVIEHAPTIALPRLAHPVEAFLRVSRDLAGTERYVLRDGRSLSALEIQREYLAAARQYADSLAVVPLWYGRALSTWADLLDRLEHSPDSLSRDLDWAAKRRLMAQALRTRGSSWDEMERWGGVLALLQGTSLAADASADELVGALDFAARAELERLAIAGGLDLARLGAVLDAYWVLVKLDLKYHEVSADGYYQVLRDQELVAREFSDDELAALATQPPRSTRGWLRGRFVAQAASRGITASAGWSRLSTRDPRRSVRLSDPFATDEALLAPLLYR